VITPVKVTGMGIVAPCGIGIEAFWEGLLTGHSTAKRLPHLEEQGLPGAIGCPVENFEPQQWIRANIKPARFPRHSLLAMASAEMALADAGISDTEWRSAANVSVITGTSLMDMDQSVKSVHRVSKMGARAAMPYSTFTFSPISISESIAGFIPARTRIASVQNACCSGIDAICDGANAIAHGETSIAVCGGTEAPLLLHPMAELTAARLTTPSYDAPEKAGRPFDNFREVGVIAEGSAYVVLEPAHSPRPAIAWIHGFANGRDEGKEPADGLFWVARQALANARTRTDEIDFISAWGPGHRIIDQSETHALQRLFGDTLENIPASSIKASIGHPLGATSALQFVATALSLKNGVIPPTANWEFEDPDCPLALSKSPRLLHPKRAIMNAHGIGNNNTVAILTAPDSKP